MSVKFTNKDIDNFLSKMEEDESLSHFGILGMRWGIRRNKKRGAVSVRKTGGDDSEPEKKKIDAKPGEEHAQKNRIKRKDLSEMTNSELKLVTERMQLEKQYKDLTAAEKAKGKNVVVQILETSAKTTATNLVTKAMMTQAEKILFKAATP